MRTVRALIKKEFQQVLRDRIMLRIIFIMPIVQLLVLGYAINVDVKNIYTMFVVLEGIDGCGKSTQAVRLADWLAGLGHKVHLTCEPTKGEVGLLIRNILGGGKNPDPRYLALLFTARGTTAGGLPRCAARRADGGTAGRLRRDCPIRATVHPWSAPPRRGTVATKDGGADDPRTQSL